MNPRSEELAYLKELIRDFPAGYESNQANKAFQKITSRYKSLENLFMREKGIAFKQVESSSMPLAMKGLTFAVHRFMFDDILSNAGELRKASDPNGGQIHYGGIKHQQQRHKFHGTSPSNIDAELDKAFGHLSKNAGVPIKQALRFYQHFVYIHPFYDGNGRIGRIVVSTYLYHFDYYILWSEFDGANNTQFINKLNKCHKRMESGFGFDEYFNYLLSFF